MNFESNAEMLAYLRGKVQKLEPNKTRKRKNVDKTKSGGNKSAEH